MGVAVALALGAGGTAWLVLRGGDVDCALPTQARDDDVPAFVGRSSLVPSGSVGDERAPVVEAADDLPAPFGDVVAGRFYGSEERVPQLVGDGGSVVLAVPPRSPGGPTTLQEVVPPEGEPTWTRTYAGGGASGGPVGDLFVTAVSGSRPTLLSIDAGSGELVGCRPVPVAKGTGDVTVLTDQAASDVVLAATRPGSPSTLSVVDPADGTVRLESTLEGPGEVGSVSAIPGQAVVSRVTRDPVRLAEMAEAGGIERPMVTAYSLDDGSPTWTYPRGKRAPLTAAAVLDSDPATGETYVLAVSGPGRAGTASSLVALDADGRVRWSQFLGAGYWDASIADDLLLVQGPASGGGALLRALHREDGARAWTLFSRDYPAGKQALQRFGPATSIDGSLVMTAPGGLAVVDPASGDTTRVRTPLRVDQVLPVGGHVLLKAGAALLVLEGAG